MRRAVAFAITLVFTACKRPAGGPPGEALGDGGADNDTASAYETIDAGSAEDGGAGGPVIVALATPTVVSSGPAFPPHDPTRASDERAGVVRLGYLRKGAQVTVRPGVLKKSSCPEGWYELVAGARSASGADLGGGFVCGKYATLDLSNKELASAPHAPFDDRPLPYDYGLNLTNGVPLYRRPPLRKERAQFERGLAVGKSPTSHGRATASVAGIDGEKPWYLKEHGGQRPQVKFDELRGESTLLEQRMVRGFYLALDKDVRAFSGKFWRTTRGFYAPADHILLHRPKTEFEGVRIGAPDEARKLPLGFILGLKARRYSIEEGKDKPKRSADFVSRFTTVGLTGKKVILDSRAYWETTEGWWMRDLDGTIAVSTTAPKEVNPGEKWVDVNVKSQTLIAYEGETPVFATLTSTGRPEHPTVLGTFRIREKHVAATMDADDSSDGPYSIQDVPWIMYFQSSYALHGAFWHAGFGHVRSHGCVNLQPQDAKTLFQWAGPVLPSGWHGVRATAGNPGTLVSVHE